MRMLHNLTVGHLDLTAIVGERRVVVLRPLEMEAVHRLLTEFGALDPDGSARLEGGKVEFREGYLICPAHWRLA